MGQDARNSPVGRGGYTGRGGMHREAPRSTRELEAKDSEAKNSEAKDLESKK